MWKSAQCTDVAKKITPVFIIILKCRSCVTAIAHLYFATKIKLKDTCKSTFCSCPAFECFYCGVVNAFSLRALLLGLKYCLSLIILSGCFWQCQNNLACHWSKLVFFKSGITCFSLYVLISKVFYNFFLKCERGSLLTTLYFCWLFRYIASSLLIN